MAILLNGREIRNAVEEAVYGILGGPTKTAIKVECSGQAVHLWIERGKVRTDKVFDLEDATANAGCRISARELAGKTAWNGPSRHPDALRSQAQEETISPESSSS